MVTFAQAQERAEEWINGDLPPYQHQEVRVREFALGFVAWAEGREGGPTADAGRQRLVVARDSGEATLWPGLPVGEVIRRYEEEYGVAEAPVESAPPVPPARIDLNQTSFLLSPPEWLQDAADKIGLPQRPNASQEERGDAEREADADTGAAPVSGAGPVAGSGAASVSSAGADSSDGSETPAAAIPLAALDASVSASVSSGGSDDAYEPTAMDGVPAGPAAPAAPASPWADANASSGGVEGVPLPATVFAPPLSGADDEDAPPPVVGADAPTALMQGGSALPKTAVAPRLDPSAAPAPVPAAGAAPAPVAPPGATPPPVAPPGLPGAGDIADAATSKATLPPKKAAHGPVAPPSPPGVPGAGSGGPAPAPAYVPTQLMAQTPPPAPGPVPPPGPAPAPGQPGTPPPPAPPGPVTPPQPVHHAATMLAHPGPGGPGAAAPPPPPPPPGAPGGAGTPAHGIEHAPTMLAQPGPGGPGAGPGAPPPPPGPAPAAPRVPGPAPASGYGYPQQPAGVPTVGPGYQAVLRYRAPDGSEQQVIRRSAPGTPHPEWQILHELRGLGVPPQQVLELHTELASCELPGGYCARMIRETWPQARITSIAPYGRDHAGRQQGMRQLLTHQGELHQVADGPARPAPVRAPLPQVQPAPPVPPEGVAQELAGAFGPGILRFDQRAVSRQGVPEAVAVTLMWAGLPADFGPFFWAQPAMPVVPTLAELAQQRQVPAAADASSYLVLGSDFGRAICVQYGTAHIVAVPVEAGPGGASVPPQFVNTGLPEFARSMALLGRMWRLRFGLTPEQAGRWTVDFQAQLAMLDPAALSSPENWWSVLLEQMWDGLL
ncbi:MULTISPECIES: SUKH-4 family immunity protein [Streptomyces]|uniref:SUKH-4 family immunity protein n=1 Tax=Streptomyces TaxID=1883 RepID=UPI0020304B8C|nr:SUKH-4 family immunity protein [Streptomyces sp. G2]MCM1945345.1 SUKH-4 family immunity protein [Streptomyces sp. G2]